MKEAKRCSFLNGLLKQTWDSLFLLIISESFCKWNEFFNVFMYGKYATKNPNQWFDFYFFVLLMYLFQSGDVIMIVIFLKTLKIDLIMTLLFCATVCVFLKITVTRWFIPGISCLACLVPALRGRRPPTHPCQQTSCFDGADVLVRKLLKFFSFWICVIPKYRRAFRVCRPSLL